MDKQKAHAVMDDLLEELGLPVTMHGSMVVNGIDDPGEEPYPDYKIEIRPHTCSNDDIKRMMEILERHDLELYWYSFNQTGHLRVVEPGEVRG